MIMPLYDVKFSPLVFTLANDCETIGDSNIQLSWTDPAGGSGTATFPTSPGEHVTFPEFASTWSQVSASSNLHRPVVEFFDTHPAESWWP